MWQIFKKIIGALIVLWAIALTLNLKFGDRPAREWTKDFWDSEPVQSVYQELRDRALAVFNKEINVEEAFQKSPQSAKSRSQSPVPKPNIQEVDLDKLSKEDRQKLQQILDKN